METISALLSICVGNQPVMVGFLYEGLAMHDFDVILNKRLIRSRVFGDSRRHDTHVTSLDWHSI